MNDDGLPQLGGLAAIFPFVMVLSATFSTGLMFTLVNIPLLLEAPSGLPDASLVDVAKFLAVFWGRKVAAVSGFGLTFLSVLAVFSVGLVVQPFATVYVTVLGKLVERLVGRHWAVARFHSPTAFFGDQYLPFLNRMFRHRAEKTHWEWELFHHYLYAGVAFNALCGAILTWRHIGFGLWESVVLAASVLLFSGYSLVRSAVVRRVHEFYSESPIQDPPGRADP